MSNFCFFGNNCSFTIASAFDGREHFCIFRCLHAAPPSGLQAPCPSALGHGALALFSSLSRSLNQQATCQVRAMATRRSQGTKGAHRFFPVILVACDHLKGLGDLNGAPVVVGSSLFSFAILGDAWRRWQRDWRNAGSFANVPDQMDS